MTAKYKVNKKQMIDIVEAYRQRAYVEEMDLMGKLGGTVGILEALNVDPDVGISSSSLDERTAVFGTHHKEPATGDTFCSMVAAALDDFMLKLLIVCATFSIVVDMSFAASDPDPTKLQTAWIEGFAIFVAVAIVSLVSAWSDYQKQTQFLEQQKLEELSKKFKCLRDGKELIVHRNDLKCGDIIQIVGGMNIPVDGLVVSGVGIMADEASMTGESDHLQKEGYENCLTRKAEHEADNKSGSNTKHDVPSPLLLSGTQIQVGDGFFICIVVGEETCEGQIMAALEDEGPAQTPLQEKLDVIAIDIGKLGMYAALLIFHCLLLRNFIEGMIFRRFDLFGGEFTSTGLECASPDDELCTGMFMLYIKEWLHYLIVGVAIIVVAVPEGLPLAVMISLAYSVKKMLIDQNFVKRLASCEIMGGANNICSDKTGTLTKNQMTWTDIWAGADKKILDADGTNNFNTTDFVKSANTMSLLGEAVACNTLGTDTDAAATELAMLKFIKRCGVDFISMRQKHVGKEPLRFPFDSARKRMSTGIKLDAGASTEHGYPVRLHVKGASEIVLETCTHYLNEDGVKTELKDDMKQQLNEQIKTYAKQALRTIAFGYKDLKQSDGGKDHKDIDEGSKIYKIEETGFTLICIAGIKDIIRPEVPSAIRDCNQAGVRVRMVTGDMKITAIAIAKECGLIKEGEENEECVCMDGPEFAQFVGGLVHKKTRESILVMGKEGENEVIGNLENMKIVQKKLKVLSRSRPNDKYIMVSGLRQLGDIVAVTGDGTNDAPALKKADVGFAMKTGTNVAHNAADIIIQDDNFASIVKACSWGRNVFDNIRRFLQFQLTVNVVALITSFIGGVILKESPLAAIQLLWVNMIMDSLASLALATETPKPELLQRPPYRKKEYIINQKMVKHILGQGLFQAVFLFVFIFAGPYFIPEGVEGPFNVDSDLNIGLTPAQALIHDWSGEFVMNGMMADFEGKDIYKQLYDTTPSRHLSVVFNLFVVFQIFNMLAARKIEDEFNIFSGMHTNPMFIGVWLVIVVGQVFIVQYGSIAMKVHIAGLTGAQWGLCMGVGFLTLIWNMVLKLVPDRICPMLGEESEDEIREAYEDYLHLRGLAEGNKK